MNDNTAFIAFNAILLGLASVLSYANIPINLAVALLFVMAADVFLGILKARAVGVLPSSRKAANGILGKCAAIVVIGSGALVLKELVEDPEYLINFFLISIILSEFYSNVRSLHTIYTGEELPEWTVWSMLGKAIVKKAEAIFNRLN